MTQKKDRSEVDTERGVWGLPSWRPASNPSQGVSKYKDGEALCPCKSLGAGGLRFVTPPGSLRAFLASHSAFLFIVFACHRGKREYNWMFYEQLKGTWEHIPRTSTRKGLLASFLFHFVLLVVFVFIFPHLCCTRWVFLFSEWGPP